MESLLSHLKLRLSKRSELPGGFTLVELLVSLGIITLLLSVVLLGQTNFNRTITLTDVVYNIGISVREMQSFGLSSPGVLQAGGPTIGNAGYGVHFDAQTPNAYSQFADFGGGGTNFSNLKLIPGDESWCPKGTPGTPTAKPGDCVYSGSLEEKTAITLKPGYLITNMCGIVSGGSGTTYCTSDYGDKGAIDVVYVRPNMQAILSMNVRGVADHLTTACVFVSSPDRTVTRMIKVSWLGQVTISSDTSCTP